jgi:hypothetical protein
MQDLRADDATNQLLAELHEFARAYDPMPEGRDAVHWYHRSDDLPAHNFNREIVSPGEDDKAPDGCLRVMSDSNFYEIANLPFRFTALSCAEIVSALWPDIEQPAIYPDHGDYWWTAISDPNLEVPGQPFELWFHTRQGGSITDSMRFDAFATEQEAVEIEAKGKTGAPEGSEPLFEVKVWRDGERLDGDLRPMTNVVYSKPREPIAWP